MFCMECGTKLPEQAKFCFKCGNKVNFDYVSDDKIDSDINEDDEMISSIDEEDIISESEMLKCIAEQAKALAIEVLEEFEYDDDTKMKMKEHIEETLTSEFIKEYEEDSGVGDDNDFEEFIEKMRFINDYCIFANNLLNYIKTIYRNCQTFHGQLLNKKSRLKYSEYVINLIDNLNSYIGENYINDLKNIISFAKEMHDEYGDDIIDYELEGRFDKRINKNLVIKRNGKYCEFVAYLKKEFKNNLSDKRPLYDYYALEKLCINHPVTLMNNEKYGQPFEKEVIDAYVDYLIILFSVFANKHGIGGLYTPSTGEIEYLREFDLEDVESVYNDPEEYNRILYTYELCNKNPLNNLLEYEDVFSTQLHVGPFLCVSVGEDELKYFKKFHSFRSDDSVVKIDPYYFQEHELVIIIQKINSYESDTDYSDLYNNDFTFSYEIINNSAYDFELDKYKMVDTIEWGEWINDYTCKLILTKNNEAWQGIDFLLKIFVEEHPEICAYIYVNEEL